MNKFQITKLNLSKNAPPQVSKLKCDPRVVITRNIDVAGGVINGTIGTVENIQPNLITVRRLKDNELMCITRIKHYVSLRHSTDIAIREQFPLILGWAITVHRVQGMTISSNVFVLDSTFFASGQAYVALSYSYSTGPGIYGSKPTRVRGRSPRTRAVYVAINPWQPCCNYYRISSKNSALLIIRHPLLND